MGKFNTPTIPMYFNQKNTPNFFKGDHAFITAPYCVVTPRLICAHVLELLIT